MLKWAPRLGRRVQPFLLFGSGPIGPINISPRFSIDDLPIPVPWRVILYVPNETSLAISQSKIDSGMIQRPQRRRKSYNRQLSIPRTMGKAVCRAYNLSNYRHHGFSDNPYWLPADDEESQTRWNSISHFTIFERNVLAPINPNPNTNSWY